MNSDNKFVRSLIENAKQGNNAAIEQLFQMNLGKIYAFVLRLTANKSLAESITKETFIEAWKKINLVRSDSSFLKWLSAIAVYQTIDTIRSKSHKQKKVQTELREFESKDEIDKYILTLPDQERMIFVLNKIEGYTIDEISDMMGIKKDQVRVHLDIAITKLIDNEPSLSNESVMNEKISKVIPELQPSVEVRNSIFSYMMNVKIREQREQERIAEALAEKEKPVEEKEEIPVEKDKPTKKEEIKPPNKMKLKMKLNFDIIKKVVYTIIGLIAIVAVYIFLTSLSSGWKIISFTGQPKIDQNIISKDDRIAHKQVIETDGNSSLTVMMDDLGRLFIDSSTIVSRTSNSHEIKLDKGHLRKFEGKASDVLTVITPLAKLTEMYKGSAFRLQVDYNQSCILSVESGWVIISIKEFDSYVPKNFNCLITKGKYAIPYSPDSSPQLISMLENFTGSNDPSVGTILSLITKKESLPLWHILQLVSTENRNIAFERLNELIPVPSGVTKEGILALNKTMLLDWLQEIELKMD